MRLFFLAILLARFTATVVSDIVPHVDTCNYCLKCIVDGDPPQAEDLLKLTFKSKKGDGVQSNIAGNDELNITVKPVRPIPRLAPYLQPLDIDQKAMLPNCTVCRGCNAELEYMSTQTIRFKNINFQHGQGATNNFLFFASVPGWNQRSIAKVFCIPISKAPKRKGIIRTAPVCSLKQATERIELLLAQQKLAADCGMQEVMPRVWLAKLSAIMPGVGLHIRWHALWMEEARGINLHALHMSMDAMLTMSLLQSKLNRTQVMLGAIWDLLTAQCDRHSENIFIDSNGNLQFIDNDKALGVVTHCGYDSMLLPGTRYHSVLRVGFWHHIATYYRKIRQTRPKLCHGIVDARFVMDYRCTATPGVSSLGTMYPLGIEQCLRKLSDASMQSIMTEYGLSKPEPANILRMRASDMLVHGFEWTLKHGSPGNSPRFKMPLQPPCCSLKMTKQRMMVCETCWQPLLPEDFSNSTDLSLVTSLINSGKDSSRNQVARLQLTLQYFYFKLHTKYISKMKFCHVLESTSTRWAEYRTLFLFYKFMKKQLKGLATSNHNSVEAKAAEDAFVETLCQQIRMLNNLRMERQASSTTTLADLQQSAERSDHEQRDRTYQALVNFHGETLLLMHWSILGYTAIVKLLKKHHKRTGILIQAPHLRDLLSQPSWSTEVITGLISQAEAIINRLQIELFGDEASGPLRPNPMSSSSSEISAENQALINTLASLANGEDSGEDSTAMHEDTITSEGEEETTSNYHSGTTSSGNGSAALQGPSASHHPQVTGSGAGPQPSAAGSGAGSQPSAAGNTLSAVEMDAEQSLGQSLHDAEQSLGQSLHDAAAGVSARGVLSAETLGSGDGFVNIPLLQQMQTALRTWEYLHTHASTPSTVMRGGNENPSSIQEDS
ncbi:hypothetical protein CEUSTIGMA_g12164.t1 [Chlamydomonas eustigma]|uniref:SPX domain-containing protein n=1 Tax=Chlamydomonas eustigma TaxID=1157962 RepID=A0A250XP91_9CHLO|nr:hypothetical protein CEUSTIGMA_g12164.t1 [Chlamydomonas eustigma]|eukprot:GAX84742.1 hypothetical protein CEUSTIGMA_g12164.t1 [Chlamydomonas eustigma]